MLSHCISLRSASALLPNGPNTTRPDPSWTYQAPSFSKTGRVTISGSVIGGAPRRSCRARRRAASRRGRAHRAGARVATFPADSRTAALGWPRSRSRARCCRFGFRAYGFEERPQRRDRRRNARTSRYSAGCRAQSRTRCWLVYLKGARGGSSTPLRDRGDGAIPRGVGVFLEEFRDLLGEIGGHRDGADLRLHLGNGLPDFDSLNPRAVLAGERFRVGDHLADAV